MYPDGCGKPLTDLDLKVNRSEYRLACHLANYLCFEIREVVEFHFWCGTCSWPHQFKILQEGPFGVFTQLC
jgi:hypothetical protein